MMNTDLKQYASVIPFMSVNDRMMTAASGHKEHPCGQNTAL